jgi:hypothetical protein
MSQTEQPKYYRFSFRGVKLDPYRIMQVYEIKHPAHQHALKKLLRAGKSVKSLTKDIDEVILALNRWKEMLNEEAAKEDRCGKIIDEIISGAEDKEIMASLTKAERKIYKQMLKELQRTDLTIPEGQCLRKQIDKIMRPMQRSRAE